MYHFFYNLFASLFTLVSWNGMLIDSAAFVFAIASVLFIANFTCSLITGYNPFWRLMKWIDKRYPLD